VFANKKKQNEAKSVANLSTHTVQYILADSLLISARFVLL